MQESIGYVPVERKLTAQVGAKMRRNRDTRGKGSVVVERTQIVFEHDEPVFFPVAQRFKNGTIWSGHSIGGHTTDDERGHCLWSPDNGKTWKECVPEIPIHMACVLSDGTLLGRSGGGPPLPKDGNTYPFTMYRYKTPQSPPETIHTKVDLPFKMSEGLILQYLLPLGDGPVLANAYGSVTDKRYRSYVIKSTDEGRTWSYLSTIASDEPGELVTSREGPCEPGWARTVDGSILCLMRTDGPLWQARSRDGGRTWDELPPLSSFRGSCPQIFAMSNGVLVALFDSYARQLKDNPNINFLIDYEGTDEEWNGEFALYRGESCGYTSLVEIEPRLLMMFYDESAFVTGRRYWGEQYPSAVSWSPMYG